MTGVVAHLAEIDERLAAAARELAAAAHGDRRSQCAAAGAYELLFDSRDAVRRCPGRGIELARRYGSADSPSFVNGVLDKIRKHWLRLRDPCPRVNPSPHSVERPLRAAPAAAADLHLHSTCSDGAYTPAHVVDLARRSGLAAIALTDHDTLAGIAGAVSAAAGTSTEIVTGWNQCRVSRRELHLLATSSVRRTGPVRSALEASSRNASSASGRWWPA